MTNTLTYDADCGFCTKAAEWLESHSDHTHGVALQAFDYVSVGLTQEEISSAAYFIRNDGRIFRGTVAMGHALLAARFPWRLLGLPLVLPVTSRIGQMLYPVLARNRHRLPGGTRSCELKQQKGTRL